MPRYFFDTDDGETAMRDEYGIELANEAAARDVAVRTLPEMAQQTAAEGDRQEMAVHVRNESDEAVLEAKLKLDVAWKASGRGTET